MSSHGASETQGPDTPCAETGSRLRSECERQMIKHAEDIREVFMTGVRSEFPK